MLKKLASKKLQLFIIIFFTILAYSNIFPNKFIGDDEIFILDWQLPKELGNIPKMFTVESVPKGHEEGGYRPIRAVFFALTYQLWKTNPWGYHLNSIIIHLIITILVYFITRHLILTPGVKKMRLHPRGGEYLPLITALLFGLHPIHTEAVTQIIASFDTLGISFMLASFYFYLKARPKFPKFSKTYLLSVILGWVAFFYYEMALVLPLMIGLYDFCFRRKKLMEKPVSYIVKFYGPFILGVVLFLSVRVGLFHLVSRGGYIDNSFYLTMLLMSRVFVIYTKLLLWPVGLSLNHTIAPGVQVWVDPFTNMDFIRSQSIFNLDVLFNIGVFTSLIFLFFRLLRKAPIASFGIGWYLIGFLPASYIIPTGALLQERYIYLASVGPILVISYALFIIGYKIKNKAHHLSLLIFLTFAFLLLAFYFYQTYQRNKDWKDPITFYEKLTSQIPNHIVSNYTLATLYDQDKDFPKAIETYEKVLKLEPNIPNIYYQLGKDYLKIDNQEKAQANFSKVLKFYPDHIGAKVFLQRKNIYNDSWKPYLFQDKYVFFSPPQWQVKKDQNKVIVSSPEEDPEIIFTIYKKDLEFTDEKNIDQFKTQGILLNQSLAKFPKFDKAYAKIWQIGEQQKLEFFIIEPRDIISILIFPYTNNSREEAKKIAGSLQRI